MRPRPPSPPARRRLSRRRRSRSRTSRRPPSARGAALPLLAVSLAVLLLAGAVLAGVTDRAQDRARAQAAADAAALAGAVEGRSAAADLARRNGARLTQFVDHGSSVVVQVTLDDATAEARAERHLRLDPTG